MGLKRDSLPNIVMMFDKPKKAVQFLRLIYSILYESEVPVYEVKEENLSWYYNDEQLPDEKYRVPDDTNEVGDVARTG